MSRGSGSVLAPNRLWALGVLMGTAAVLIAHPHYLEIHHQDFMIFLLINVLVVVSYRLMNLTGEWSLIHAVMLGIGGYTSALFAKEAGWSFGCQCRWGL